MSDNTKKDSRPRRRASALAVQADIAPDAEAAEPVATAPAAPAQPQLAVIQGGLAGEAAEPVETVEGRAARERAIAEAQAVSEMNRHHACILHGGQVYVIVEDETDGTYCLTSLRALSEWLACKPLFVNALNERTHRLERKRVDRAVVWKQHPNRRNVRRMEFAPERNLGDDIYNMWRGWGVKPVYDMGGAALPIIEHIRTDWCSGNPDLYRWVMSWFAQLVQDPCHKPGTALVLRGAEGTGKGTLADVLMRRLCGSAHAQISNPGQVTGRFNGHWQNKLAVFCDESFWAGDKAAEGVLKALITEPKIGIEYKGKDLFQVDHLARCIFATNNDWAVPAGPTNRRFGVLDVANTHRGDEAYFNVLHACVAGDGAASFFGYLLSYDYSGVNLRKPPVTKGLIDQKILSLESVPGWWKERLWNGFVEDPARPEDGGEWSDVIPTARLYASYLAYCKRTSCRYPEGEEGFSRKLREFASLERKRGSRTDAGRPWVMSFKGEAGIASLDALRGQFEMWIGGPVDWGTSEQDDVESLRPAPDTIPDEIDRDCPF
jgi:hypothetical protein